MGISTVFVLFQGLHTRVFNRVSKGMHGHSQGRLGPKSVLKTPYRRAQILCEINNDCALIKIELLLNNPFTDFHDNVD